MGDLEGKVIAITGAAPGMGREFTQAYLKKFLEDKTLSAKDMLEFYYAADAKAPWRAGNDELEALIKEWVG